MSRPIRAWWGVVVGCGVLAGCAQKPSETAPDASASTPDVVIDDGHYRLTRCKFDTVEKTIADARGKVVLIDLWATWCGPCVASFPKLVEKHEKYAKDGLVVVSLSTDDAADTNAVFAFLKKNNATFTNFQVPLDAASQKAFQGKLASRNSIPHAALFNRTGTRVWAGHPTMDPQLTPLIEAELAKSVTAP